jgi:predicted nucleic acid-binding protein
VSPQAIEVDDWLAAEESLATSAIAWTEFLNGPVTPLEVSRADAVLQSRIVPFGQSEAVLAAELFNKTGRRRGSRFDCLIAATAILAQAEGRNNQPGGFQSIRAARLKLALAAVSATSAIRSARGNGEQLVTNPRWTTAVDVRRVVQVRDGASGEVDEVRTLTELNSKSCRQKFSESQRRN